MNKKIYQLLPKTSPADTDELVIRDTAESKTKKIIVSDLLKNHAKNRGVYNSNTAYKINDVVQFSGSSYICILAGQGNDPTNTTYWIVFASKGTQGERGLNGEHGQKGDDGANGSRGSKGVKGDAGEQGLQGEVGPTGPAGARGPKGSTGLPGPKGDTGAQGPRGTTGVKGDDGTPGEKGDKGDNGTNGTNGTNGADGSDGAQGPQGDQGIQGEQGVAGENGSNGSNGADGADGAPGAPGDPGAPGADGGFTGKYVTEQKSDDYDVLIADAGKALQMNTASDKAFNLPAISSGDVGTVFIFEKLNSGKLTIQTNSGQSIADSAADGTIFNSQPEEIYATITLKAISTTLWAILGFDGTWSTT